MAIALGLMVLVSYQLYLRHFVQYTGSQTYQFDDLPGTAEIPVTANIDDIIGKHIFGVVPKVTTTRQQEVVKTAPKPAPKTRLNIKLTGIIHGSTADSGIAMLEVDRGRTIVVAVGDQIGKTDAVLHQVLPGEILIDRGGSIESVKMVRKTLSIAKLESDLLDSLPQPYIGEPVSNTYEPPATATTAQQPPDGVYSRQEGVSKAQNQTESYNNNADTVGEASSLPDTERKPMKTLPIPRMLQ